MRLSRQEMRSREAALIQRCIATVQATLGDAKVELELPPEAHSSDFEQADGELRIRGPWGTTKFILESKQRLTIENITPVIARMKRRHTARPLMMSEYINPEMAGRLRTQHINFVDTVGNIYLDAPPLFVWQHGLRGETPDIRPARLFQVAGLKILSVLLWEPAAVDLTYRNLADRAGVALGSIVPVFDDLARAGFIRTVKKQRRLRNQRELLDQWVLGYAGQLFPRLILNTCRLAGSQNLDALVETLRWHRLIGEVLLGGEAAAGLATGHLRPARATIHLASDNLATWMGALKLIPDPEGNVNLVQRFAEGNQWEPPPPQLEGIHCANPVLMYGELLRMGTDERLRETADLLLEEFIAPRFRQEP